MAGLHKNALSFLSSSVAAQTLSYFSSYSPVGVCAGIYFPVLALERSSNPHAEDGHHPGCLLFPRLEHHPTRRNGGRDGGRRGGRERLPPRIWRRGRGWRTSGKRGREGHANPRNRGRAMMAHDREGGDSCEEIRGIM